MSEVSGHGKSIKVWKRNDMTCAHFSITYLNWVEDEAQAGFLKHSVKSLNDGLFQTEAQHIKG